MKSIFTSRLLGVWFRLFIALTFFSSASYAMKSNSPFDENEEPKEKDPFSVIDLGGKKKKAKAASALMNAVVEGQWEIVKLLVEKGADINQTDKDGWTALMWAVHYDRKDIVELLIEKGADINIRTKDDRTPLILAIRDDHHDITKLLIKSGADVNMGPRKAESAVGLAIDDQQPQIAKLMIEKNVFLAGAPRGKEFPLVIAEGGYTAKYPENTVIAFAKAVEEKVDMVSVPVRLTKDGKVVVAKYADLERVTSGTGKVREKTWEELESLDAGAWFGEEFKGLKIPTLEQVMRKIGGDILINIELRCQASEDGTMTLERKVIDLIESNDLWSSVIVAAFDLQRLRNLRNMSKKVNLAIMSEKSDKNLDVIDLIKGLKACAYEPNWRDVTPEVVSKFHKAGIMVMPWANKDENTENTMREMLKCEVDGFFALDPVMLKKMIGKKKPAKAKIDEKEKETKLF